MSHFFTYIGLKWDNYFPPHGLKHMQVSPSGSCARNHKTGVVVWKWGKSRGHKGKYVQEIRGKFREFEREERVATLLHSSHLWGKIEITADCPSLRLASALHDTSEIPLYAVKRALWWSLSSLSHWTMFLWQVRGTISLLWAHSATGRCCKASHLCCSCALKSSEKWILPAEITLLEKNDLSNSSFAAIRATHTAGVAQPSQHRLSSCTERTTIG